MNTNPNPEPEADVPQRVKSALRRAYAAPEVPPAVAETVMEEFRRRGAVRRVWRGRRMWWASAGMAASVALGVVVIRVMWPPAPVTVLPERMLAFGAGEGGPAGNAVAPTIGGGGSRGVEGGIEGGRGSERGDLPPSGEPAAPAVASGAPADQRALADGTDAAKEVAQGRSLADAGTGRFGSSSVSNVADPMLKAVLARPLGDLDGSGGVDVLDAMLLAIRVRDGLAKNDVSGGLVEDLNRDQSIDRLDVETLLRQAVRVEGAG